MDRQDVITPRNLLLLLFVVVLKNCLAFFVMKEGVQIACSALFPQPTGS